MKAGLVAALAGSVAAAVHQGHNGFHFRRSAVDDGVCTVYTTVYVTASALPVSSSFSSIATSQLYSALSSAKISVPPPVASSSKPAPAPPAPSVYAPVVPSSKPAAAPSSAPPVSLPMPVISSSKPAPAPVPSSSSVYVPAPIPSSSKPAPVPSSSSVAVPSSTKSETPKPTGGSGYGANLIPNGQKMAVTYTPYDTNGQCMPKEKINDHIAKIAAAGYPHIRVYSTDCGVFENLVPIATKAGLKIIYGVFLDEAKGPGSAGANQQLDAIIKNAPKDSFSMLIVGNEYISGHGGSAATLAPYIKSCKEKLVAAGFSSNIPVTTAETVDAWEKNGAALCDSVDVIAAQIHPYFDGGVVAGKSGEFAVTQLAQAAKSCPKAAANGQYITECGWPKEGKTNGVAVPGVQQQKEAIASIIKSVGSITTLFSYQDDAWKEPGPFGVERKFGCADVL